MLLDVLTSIGPDRPNSVALCDVEQLQTARLAQSYPIESRQAVAGSWVIFYLLRFSPELLPPLCVRRSADNVSVFNGVAD